MTYYYKNTINKKALPYMFQILRTGYRNPDFSGWDSMRAILSVGYSKKSKRFHFMFKPFKKDLRHKK